MLTKEQTKLETFGFGDKPEDTFYCLLDLTRNPKGIDLKKLSSTSPEKLDEIMEEMGCLILLSGNDVEKITGSKEFDPEELHHKLFEMGREEGMIK